jgi:hypothetical protein
MREPGFYWVKHNEFKGWEIALFDVNKNWTFTGWGKSFYEEEVAEIDERRIVRDEQCKDNQFKGAKLKVWDKDWNLIGTINCDPAE